MLDTSHDIEMAPHLSLHASGSEECFAPWRGTAVQDAIAWLGVQHCYHQPSCLILDLQCSGSRLNEPMVSIATRRARHRQFTLGVVQ